MKKEHSPKNKVRHFASVEHLNPEAVAAFVDNELSPAAAHRAKIHLVHCPECREEIHRQRGGPPRGGAPPPPPPPGAAPPRQQLGHAAFF